MAISPSPDSLEKFIFVLFLLLLLPSSLLYPSINLSLVSSFHSLIVLMLTGS